MVDFPIDPGHPQTFSQARRTSLRAEDSGSTSFGPYTRQRIPSRNSTISIQSRADSETSEIHAPVPRRHHLLQQNESQWLHTPDISPTSSRPVSPGARPRQMASFSALMEEKNPYKHREEEVSGWARQWVRWMHRNSMRGWVLPVTMLAASWIKWVVGLGGYSGYNTPPMFGDFEAQRHWLEITINLPTRKWYTYDLLYWGLDYPPLTAYHSWILGKFGSWVEPSWFVLDSSRGIETEGSKVFMRATVLISDLLVYFPAVYLFARRCLGHRSGRTQHVALISILLQPALILIDSGHFQYNSVMLGFTLLCLDYLTRSSDLLAAVFFVMSLGFKQMGLYYAPAIGSYLLSKCIFLGPLHGWQLFIRLGLVTVASLLLLFLPWLSPSAILNPITRIFPFTRGLFEDKVANFWCSSDVIMKWRRWLSPANLVRLSTILTATGFAPAVWGLLYGGWMSSTKGGSKSSSNGTPCPTLALLPYALLTSSLSFFLFSFQVHEKSILLPLLPATLLLIGAESGTGEDREWGILFNNVAVFSMWPLLKKDGLALQYVSLTALWNCALGYNPFDLKSGFIVRALSLYAYSAILVLHLAEALITPPARYPDLFPVLNVLVSASIFVSVWLWSIKRGVEISWALSGPPKSKTRDSHDRESRRLSLKSDGARVRRRSAHMQSGEVIKEKIQTL